MTDADERGLLNGLSRWRLVLVNALAGNLTEAETWLNRLRETQPNSPYRQLAERFWETWGRSNNLRTACEAANTFAAANRATLVEPLNTFGYANPQFEPSDMCIVAGVPEGTPIPGPGVPPPAEGTPVEPVGTPVG
jgi:hypothetical protein